MTSNLCKHAKACWGEEAIAVADNAHDMDAAHENMIRDGSIAAEFQWIGKGKTTYSMRQHTKAEAQ